MWLRKSKISFTDKCLEDPSRKDKYLWVRIVFYIILAEILFSINPDGSFLNFGLGTSILYLIISLPIILFGFLLYFCPERDDKISTTITDYISEYGYIGLIMMPLLAAFIIPLSWALEDFDASLTTMFENHSISFLENCIMLATGNLYFFVLAMEWKYLNNRRGYKHEKEPVWQIIFTYLISIFVFPAIKELCKWIMNYSPESGFACLMLILALTVLPIGVLVAFFLFLDY